MAKSLSWLLFSLVMTFPLVMKAQIQVDTTFSATELVKDILLGKRVEAKNVRYIGSKLAVAVFRDTSASPLIKEGLLLSTGKVFDAVGPNRRANTTYNIGTRGDRSLEVIAKGMTFDAATLEFDFVPEMEMVAFNFFFGSEEYTEYVNTQFNDVFAFLISGPGYKGVKNLAVVPKNNAPITVNSVNHLYNRSNYIDNNPFDRLGTLVKEKQVKLYPDLLRNYEYDGFTTLLTAEARVKPGEVYHIKICIADVSDGRYDSAVFLEGNSFTSLPRDPVARAELLTAEYGNLKRKFRPVRVGEDPQEPLNNYKVTAEDLEATSADWNFLVNFEFDESELTATEMARLDSIWMHVLSKSNRKIVVQGHTDSVGAENYNDQLAARRAARVLNYLRGKGLPEKRIVLESFGFHQPLSSNETDQGRARNRRVVIKWED